MSRIGKRPVDVPAGVTVEQKGEVLHVKGPKGQLSTRIPAGIGVEIDKGEVRLTRPDERKPTRALHGLARALLENMVKGVTEGFAKELRIEGVGYRAEVQGKVLNLSLGFSHPVQIPVPEGIGVSMDGNTKIRIEGIDKQLVGQFAADVRGVRPPEPYKGKGVRYAAEHVRRKVGKAGVSTA